MPWPIRGFVRVNGDDRKGTLARPPGGHRTGHYWNVCARGDTGASACAGGPQRSARYPRHAIPGADEFRSRRNYVLARDRSIRTRHTLTTHLRRADFTHGRSSFGCGLCHRGLYRRHFRGRRRWVGGTRVDGGDRHRLGDAAHCGAPHPGGVVGTERAAGAPGVGIDWLDGNRAPRAGRSKEYSRPTVPRRGQSTRYLRATPALASHTSQHDDTRNRRGCLGGRERHHFGVGTLVSRNRHPAPCPIVGQHDRHRP